MRTIFILGIVTASLFATATEDAAFIQGKNVGKDIKIIFGELTEEEALKKCKQRFQGAVSIDSSVSIFKNIYFDSCVDYATKE